jgi:hypothetical protein
LAVIVRGEGDAGLFGRLRFAYIADATAYNLDDFGISVQVFLILILGCFDFFSFLEYAVPFGKILRLSLAFKIELKRAVLLDDGLHG